MKRISLCLKILIILYLIVGLVFCFIINPYLMGIYFNNSIGTASIPEILSYITNLICSLPCYILLIFGWKAANLLEKDNTMISHDGSKLLKISGFMLSIDGLLFTITHLIT